MNTTTTYGNVRSNAYNNYKVNHKTFGGIIYNSDFCTNDSQYGLNAAVRIESAFAFDRQCGKNYSSLIRTEEN